MRIFDISASAMLDAERSLCGTCGVSQTVLVLCAMTLRRKLVCASSALTCVLATRARVAMLLRGPSRLWRRYRGLCLMGNVRRLVVWQARPSLLARRVAPALAGLRVVVQMEIVVAVMRTVPLETMELVAAGATGHQVGRLGVTARRARAVRACWRTVLCAVSPWLRMTSAGALCAGLVVIGFTLPALCLWRRGMGRTVHRACLVLFAGNRLALLRCALS